MNLKLGSAAFLIMVAALPVPGMGQGRPILLDTVEVTISSLASAEMASTTRGVQVITAAAIRDLPVRTVPEVLQWALGVDLMPRSPALVDVALRGSSFEQVLVMVDGVRVSDAQTGHFDLNLAVPLDQVERIELLRGPASTVHGADAVGGVINIVTRAGGQSRARLESGSFGTVGLALAHTVSLDGSRLDAAADLRRSDGHRPGTDYEMGQGRLALSTPLAGRNLRASVGWASRNFGAKSFYGGNPAWDEFEKTRAATATLALHSAPDARLAIDPVLSFRRHDDDFVLQRDDPSFYQNQHTTDQAGGKIGARYAAAPGLRLAAGGEAFIDRLESSSLGQRTENRAALLGEVAVGKVGALTTVAGLRSDWHETQGAFLSPSLATAWWPTAGLKLRGSVGRALRTPTWTERYYQDPANQGNPDLSPERSWSGELGVVGTPGAGVRLGIAAFQRESDDLIDWARAAGTTEVWVTRNVESARFRGIEAEVSVADAAGLRIVAQGSWLSVSSSAADGVESKYALRPLTESFSLAAERRLPGGVGLSVRGLHARRVGEDSYLRVDARGSLELSSLRLHADVLNLGDTDYLDIAQINAAGRSLLIGIEWRGR
jgi:iron complex outermembrane receptor protein